MYPAGLPRRFPLDPTGDTRPLQREMQHESQPAGLLFQASVSFKRTQPLQFDVDAQSYLHPCKGLYVQSVVLKDFSKGRTSTCIVPG